MSKDFHGLRFEPASMGSFESLSNYFPSAGLLSLVINLSS